MSNPEIYLTVGSVGRAWAVQLLDATGGAVNLTGATSVTFSMRARGSATRKVNGAAAAVANGTYTLADGSSRSFTPADGVLIYQPVANDIDTAGLFEGQFSYAVGGAPVIDPGEGYVEIFIQPAV